MISRLVLSCVGLVITLPAHAADRTSVNTLVAQYARAHGVPEALVHRIIARESGYNSGASRNGFLGLMQIRYETARGMGYTGPASGLLDAGTNLTYAVPYLANAYKVSGGDPDRAVSLYSRGYYYEAKRKGLLRELRTGLSQPLPPSASALPDVSTTSSIRRSSGTR